jgi:hypothetical protein
MQFNSASILPYVAFDKDAFPNRQRTPLAGPIIQPGKTSPGFSREFPSAISGFRSLCGRKQRSSLSHRAR